MPESLRFLDFQPPLVPLVVEGDPRIGKCPSCPRHELAYFRGSLPGIEGGRLQLDEFPNVWGTLPTTISGVGVAVHETAGARAHWGHEKGIKRNVVAMMETVTNADIVFWMDPTGPTGEPLTVLDPPIGPNGEELFDEAGPEDQIPCLPIPRLAPPTPAARASFRTLNDDGVFTGCQKLQYLLEPTYHCARRPDAVEIMTVPMGESERISARAVYDPSMKLLVGVRDGVWITTPKRLCKLFVADDCGFDLSNVRFDRTEKIPTGRPGSCGNVEVTTHGAYEPVFPGREVYVDSPQFRVFEDSCLPVTQTSCPLLSLALQRLLTLAQLWLTFRLFTRCLPQEAACDV